MESVCGEQFGCLDIVYCAFAPKQDGHEYLLDFARCATTTAMTVSSLLSTGWRHREVPFAFLLAMGIYTPKDVPGVGWEDAILLGNSPLRANLPRCCRLETAVEEGCKWFLEQRLQPMIPVIDSWGSQLQDSWWDFDSECRRCVSGSSTLSVGVVY
jgi:hypothetical protein